MNDFTNWDYDPNKAYGSEFIVLLKTGHVRIGCRNGEEWTCQVTGKKFHSEVVAYAECRNREIQERK